ncbi:MAG: hypothetical protein H0Z34_07855 [Brevibacillus sp.]|nr:hypothetical protein [Brevibacillus sp.]
MQKTVTHLESEAESLAQEGTRAWAELYDLVVRQMRVPLVQGGSEVQLTIEEASGLLRHGHPSVRAELTGIWEHVWTKEAELYAYILNQLSGLRLALYRERGWDFILHEPLRQNRLSVLTLQAMWTAIEGSIAQLVPFLERRARLLCKKQLDWHDVWWPVGRMHRLISPQEALITLMEEAEASSPVLAAFAARAVHLPERFDTACTLSEMAAEIGQAFLQFLRQEESDSAMIKPMAGKTHAEGMMTAFLGQMLADLLANRAASQEERLAILEDKLQQTVHHLMTLHARFLFELRFYKQRKRAPVCAEALNELMLQAQKFAFGRALDRYYPYDWASDRGFYRPLEPFCHFPQTFRYLVGVWLYQQGMAGGPSFEERVIQFVRTEEPLTMEQRAARILTIDLTSSLFWKQAVDAALAGLNVCL